MILEIVSLTVGLLGQFTTLTKNENVKPVIKELSSWVSNLFSDTHSKENLKKVEEEKSSKETITNFETELDKILKENKGLQEQLQERIDRVKLKVKEEGLEEQVNKTIVKITGDKNIVLFDIDTSGPININVS